MRTTDNRCAAVETENAAWLQSAAEFHTAFQAMGLTEAIRRAYDIVNVLNVLQPTPELSALVTVAKSCTSQFPKES